MRAVQDLVQQHLSKAISLQTVLLLGFRLIGCLAVRVKKLPASPLHVQLTFKVSSMLRLAMQVSDQPSSPCMLQAFHLSTQLVILQLCTFEEHHNLLYMMPGYQPGSLREAARVTRNWPGEMGREAESWFAAASMGNVGIPRLHAAGRELATASVQAATSSWAAKCPMLLEPLSAEAANSSLDAIHAAQVSPVASACCCWPEHLPCSERRH